MTVEEVIAEIDRQLAWRSPGADKPQGHIVLKREAMMLLIEHVKKLRDKKR